MKKYLVILVLITQQFLISFAGSSQNLDNGFLDVTNVSWKNNIVKLEGTCDFYWKEFLVPLSPNDSLEGHTKLTAKIPKPWTKIELSKNNYCTPDGYGTYRMRLKVDNSDVVYGLKVRTVFSAYKLFVNGKLIESVGKLGTNKEESVPVFKTKEIPIPVYKIDSVDYQILDIVFHISNYHHRRAGLQRMLYFSTMDEIIRDTKGTLLLHLILIGIIFIIGFNHVLMYVLRRLDFGNLLFGALAMIMILRDISTGERIILHMFPNIDWEMLVRLDNFSGFGTMTFFALYFYFTFRQDFPKIVNGGVCWFGWLILYFWYIVGGYFPKKRRGDIHIYWHVCVVCNCN